MQYSQCEIQTRQSRNDVNVPRLFKNHMGGTYHMLNLCAKCILLSHGAIWPNKIYSEYTSGK